MKVTLNAINRLTLFSIAYIFVSEKLKKELISFLGDVRLTEGEMSGYPDIVSIDIEVDEKLSDLIIETLTMMYDTGKMTDDEIDLYKIFVEK